MIYQDLTPEAAVDALIALHAEATTGLKDALDHYFKTRTVPTPEERAALLGGDSTFECAGGVFSSRRRHTG